MKNITRRTLLATAAVLGLGLAGAASAQAVDLKIGWQQIVEPSRVPQASGAYEKATGANITWSQFGSGADVVAAIASKRLRGPKSISRPGPSA
jgi:taurine transport system substrate-binding protein